MAAAPPRWALLACLAALAGPPLGCTRDDGDGAAATPSPAATTPSPRGTATPSAATTTPSPDTTTTPSPGRTTSPSPASTTTESPAATGTATATATVTAPLPTHTDPPAPTGTVAAPPEPPRPLAAADPGPAPTEVPPPLCDERVGGALITFWICNEMFVVWSTADAFIDEAIELMEAGEVRIPAFGGLVDGPDCDPRWSWHVTASGMEFADATIQACDGCPSQVERNKAHWFETVQQFCPWSAVVIGVDDRR